MKIRVGDDQWAVWALGWHDFDAFKAEAIARLWEDAYGKTVTEDDEDEFWQRERQQFVESFRSTLRPSHKWMRRYYSEYGWVVEDTDQPTAKNAYRVTIARL